LEKIVEENSLVYNIDKDINKLCKKKKCFNIFLTFKIQLFKFFYFFLKSNFLNFFLFLDILGTFLDIFNVKLYCFNFYLKNYL